MLLSFSSRVLYIAKHFSVVSLKRRPATTKTIFTPSLGNSLPSFGENSDQDLPLPPPRPRQEFFLADSDSFFRLLKPRSAGAQGSYPGGGVGNHHWERRENLEEIGEEGRAANLLTL